MNPSNLTRRNLMGRLLALLFGWLWLDKKSKAQTQTHPAESVPASSCTTISTYDRNGDLIDIKEAEVGPSRMVYSYDVQNRVVKASDPDSGPNGWRERKPGQGSDKQDPRQDQ